MSRRRISCGESLQRPDWPWLLFDAEGRLRARGCDRPTTINRFERSEGRGHGGYCVVKNEHTHEEWFRRTGMWFRRREPDRGNGHA